MESTIEDIISKLSEERVRISVMEKQVKALEKEQEKLEARTAANNNACIENAIKIGNLDERQTKHAARHDSNYDRLDKKVDDRFAQLSAAIKDISEQINKMSGRDSVLKVLGGAFAGALIVWIVRSIFGV